MNNKSYSSQITVNVSPAIAFNAITQEMDQWWGQVSNRVHEKDDTFTSFFDEETRWTFRITHIEPNIAIDMECIDAHHTFTGAPAAIRQEWLGTTLRWQLSPIPDGTVIQFVHEGLVPELNCFDICSAGWDHFFVNSLQRYLDDGISIRQPS